VFRETRFKERRVINSGAERNSESASKNNGKLFREKSVSEEPYIQTE
jgi:hypothetical protein